MNLKFYLERLHASEEFKQFKKESPSAFLCSAFFSIDKQGSDNKQHFDYFVQSSFNQPLQKLPAHFHSQIDDKQLNEEAHSKLNESLDVNDVLAGNPARDFAQVIDREQNSLPRNRLDEAGFEANNNRVNGNERGRIISFQLENNCNKTELENFEDKIPAQIFDDYNFEFDKVEKLVLDKMQEKEINKELQKILVSLQNIEGVDFLVGTIFTSGFGMSNFKIDLREMIVTDFEQKSFFDVMKIMRKK